MQLEMVNFDLHDVLADSMEVLATVAARKEIGAREMLSFCLFLKYLSFRAHPRHPSRTPPPGDW